MLKKLIGAGGCFLAFAALKDVQTAGYLTAFKSLSGICSFLLMAGAVSLFVWALLDER